MRDQAADSQYYLGFLLTFVALAVSMVDLAASAGEFGQISLVARIGVALVTSILGMSSRLIMTQFHPTSEEEADRTRDSFVQQAGEFRQAMKDSIEAFKKGNRSINQSMQASGDAHARRIDELTKSSAAALEKLVSDSQRRIDAILANLQTRVGQFDLIPDDARERVEAVISGIETDIARINTSVSAVVSNFDEASRGIAGQQNLANFAFEKLVSDCQRRIDTILSNLQTRVGQFNLFPDDARERVEVVISGIETDIARINTSVSAVVSNFDEASRGIAGQKQLIANTTSEIRKELAVLRSLHQKFRKETNKLVGNSRRIISEVTKTIRDFTKKIRGLVDDRTRRGPARHEEIED